MQIARRWPAHNQYQARGPRGGAASIQSAADLGPRGLKVGSCYPPGGPDFRTQTLLDLLTELMAGGCVTV